MSVATTISTIVASKNGCATPARCVPACRTETAA